MKSTLNRRFFLRRAALALAGAPLAPMLCPAIEPFSRQGPPRLRLSLAAYSFRQYFKDGRDKGEAAPDVSKQIDLFQFIDFCAAHDCEGAELTSYYFPPVTDREFLLKLRHHAFLRGVSISGTAVGNTFTHPEGPDRQSQITLVKKWIDYAAVMGAPHIRIFAGPTPRGLNPDEAKEFCIAAVEECAKLAAEKGVFLGLENHGGIVAEPKDLLEIVRAINSPWVGINLDSGNFHTEDPYRDFELCAPYAVNVQIKSEIRRRRGGTEPADLKRMIDILRKANYQGFVALEYEAAPDPWKEVPVLLKQLRPLLAT
jgi:sugar phosphate isomerase/epimerase